MEVNEWFDFIQDIKYMARRAVLVFLALVFAALVVVGIVFSITGVASAAVAKAQPIGTPKSIVSECNMRAEFAARIIKLRDNSISEQEVRGMMQARAVSYGLPPEAIPQINEAIGRIWVIPADSETTRKLVWDACMELYNESN